MQENAGYLTIKELNIAKYTLLPGDRKSALSEYYYREISGGRGGMYALMGADEIISYLLYSEASNYRTIVYIETKAELRGNGFARQLLKEMAEHEDTVYTMHLSASLSGFPALLSAAKGAGFFIGQKSTIFTSLSDETVWKRIEDLKLEKIERLLLAKGGECLPFAKLSKDEVLALAHSSQSEFKNTLSPESFLTNQGKALNRDLSFAFWQDGKLIAYTLVTQLSSRHVVFEQISTTEQLRGRGVVLVPLYRSLLAIRKNTSIKKFSMTVNDDNEASRKLILDMLSGTALTQTTNVVLFYRKR